MQLKNKIKKGHAQHRHTQYRKANTHCMHTYVSRCGLDFSAKPVSHRAWNHICTCRKHIVAIRVLRRTSMHQALYLMRWQIWLEESYTKTQKIKKISGSHGPYGSRRRVNMTGV